MLHTDSHHLDETISIARLLTGSVLSYLLSCTDVFDVFEERYPELVAVNAAGTSTNRVDFVDGEREEMELLTRASPLDTNVWIGSNGDLPAPAPDMPSSDWTNVEAAPHTNPNNYAVCIEAHEAGDMPRFDKLHGAAQYMDSLQMSYHAAYRPPNLLSSLSPTGAARTTPEGQSVASGSLGLSLGPRGWSTSPSSTHALAATEAYSPPAARATGAAAVAARAAVPATATVPVPLASIVLMECGVTGSDRALFEPGAAQHFADQMIELAIWIKEQADPDAFAHRAGRVRPRKVLLHCADGYTETSVLALTYLLYTHPHMRVPDAYLFLQNDLQRSFFVYPREVPMLQLIEARLRAHTWPKLLTHPFTPRHTTMSNRRAVDQKDNSGKEFERDAYGATSLSSSPLTPSPSSSHSSPSSPTAQRRQQRPVDDGIRHAWFYDGLFEGSFPSRILDFLYLGNLNHAMNAGMLRALGITHVVSVGESALSVPPGMESATPFAAGKGPGVSAHVDAALPPGHNKASAITSGGRGWLGNSLWAEREAGRISVLNVQGVADDGIDPLRSSMKQAVEYIDSARRAGGKVLVHCRVGVSRSSTIVLAYVMAHLDLSLAEAYLLVRSRRLNILIQPHLLFFWELRGWESYLGRQRGRRLQLQRQRQLGSAQQQRDRICTNARDDDDDDPMDLDTDFNDAANTGAGDGENAVRAENTWWATLSRAHERTHGAPATPPQSHHNAASESGPEAGPEPEAHLTLAPLPECQQYRRQIKSVPRAATEQCRQHPYVHAYAHAGGPSARAGAEAVASAGAGTGSVLLARPSATGGAVLEQVHTLDDEEPLDCALGVGTAAVRADLPAPYPYSSSISTSAIPCGMISAMERTSTVVAGLPASSTATAAGTGTAMSKLRGPPSSCGYGHALVGYGSPRGVHPRAMRVVWGSFAQEVAHLNERYFV